MLTYEKAKKEVESLSHYIYLIDTYDINSVEDLIIYQYAIHNSISKVIRNIRTTKMIFTFEIKHVLIDTNFVRSTLLSKPKNELHALIKTGYLKKTRAQRKRSQH